MARARLAALGVADKAFRNCRCRPDRLEIQASHREMPYCSKDFPMTERPIYEFFDFFSASAILSVNSLESGDSGTLLRAF